MSLETLLEAVLVVLGIVGTAVGLASLVWAIGKVKGLELTVNLLKSGNEALRAELEDAGRRHAAELARLVSDHRSGEQAAAERISRLEGHNAALVDGLADRLATAIGDRLESILNGFVDQFRAATTNTPTGGNQ